MRRLSEANSSDFAVLLDSIGKCGQCASIEEAAQAFVDVIYNHFRESLVLLRLFASRPHSVLPSLDQLLVSKKAYDAGMLHLLHGATPVLTLLGTRGKKRDWNERDKSQGFRCIPLICREYVESLPMLCMQFRKMEFEFDNFNKWRTTVTAAGRGDDKKGMLFVADAATDRDEVGRLVVPRQEFVAENRVKSVLGYGTGYGQHPTIVTMFAFTNERLSEPEMLPFSMLLQRFIGLTEELWPDDGILRG